MMWTGLNAWLKTRVLGAALLHFEAQVLLMCRAMLMYTSRLFRMFTSLTLWSPVLMTSFNSQLADADLLEIKRP